ncbi:MAG: hypothetical protein ACFE85_13335 [Candidatus Hodarchaeota archaeon]
MIIEEVLEKPDEEVQEIYAQKPKVKRKLKERLLKFFIKDETVLFLMSLGAGVLIIILFWLFGDNIPIGWTLFS